MKLRYTGKDNDLGLKKGKVYEVDIISKDNDYIWVRWGRSCCPYESPKMLAANWEVA